MHQWGDKWFEEFGSQLDQAVDFVSTYCRRYGRFGGQTKEKFGTLRFYVMFHYGIHDLFYPGYYFIQWGKILSTLDNKIYRTKFFNPIRNVIRKYQTFVYTRAYKLAARKWPAIKTEIYVMADCHDLLQDDFDFSKHWTTE